MKRIQTIRRWLTVLLTAGGLLLLCFPAGAQQDPIYSQYMNNLMSVNPAYTGIRGVGNVTGVFRNQWVNLKGAPTTASLTMSMPIDSLHMGLGFDFIHDYTLPFSTTGFFANYSYRIRASENTQISFGLKAGVNYFQASLDDLFRYHPDDPYIIDYGDFNKVFFNAGVGVFWYSDRFYLGFSVPRLFENRYNREVDIVQANSREKQHYFLHGAYILPLSENISFKPGLTTIMTSGAPITADFDFSFLFYRRFWFGLMYRISDALGAYAQFQVQDNLKVGFSYDYSHTRIREFQGGTFEILLRYDFKVKEGQVFPFPEF
ncbi:MAG TPA: type IX secretion system membrane protein PorP/SprF [Prolixibacteraceae bacterium]|nr:type IX secretion system membrane protein PorP/SprF [Prolixibacteraceae bacterium]